MTHKLEPIGAHLLKTLELIIWHETCQSEKLNNVSKNSKTKEKLLQE